MLTKKGTEQNLSSPTRASKSTSPIRQSDRTSFGLFIGSLVIAAVLITSGFLFKRAVSPYTASVSSRLGIAISEDLASLKRKNALPQQFGNLKSFEASTESSTFKPWIDDLKVALPTAPSGTYSLQVFIFFYIDGKKYGANVQYDLVNIKTNNTDWELTRSYPLGWIF